MIYFRNEKSLKGSTTWICNGFWVQETFQSYFNLNLFLIHYSSLQIATRKVSRYSNIESPFLYLTAEERSLSYHWINLITNIQGISSPTFSEIVQEVWNFKSMKLEVLSAKSSYKDKNEILFSWRNVQTSSSTTLMLNFSSIQELPWKTQEAILVFHSYLVARSNILSMTICQLKYDSFFLPLPKFLYFRLIYHHQLFYSSEKM